MPFSNSYFFITREAEVLALFAKFVFLPVIIVRRTEETSRFLVGSIFTL